jgi:organic radical activating enzyme
VGRELIAIETPEPYLAITWQVNNYCNFSCSYCNPGNWAGANPNNGNLDLYIQNLSAIVEKYKRVGYKHFKFFFSGGEPTAWRNFIPICEWIYKELPHATLAVNTNLSRPKAWWEKYHYLFDDIVASFHVEYANKDRYKENSIYLCDKVNYLSTKMLLHDDRFWEVVEFAEELKTVMPNYFVEWTPLYDELTNDASPWEYNDDKKTEFLATHNIESIQTLPKPDKRTNSTVSYNRYDTSIDKYSIPTNSNEIIVERQNFFTGWKCQVGDCIFISPIGDITLASCGATKDMGHILNDISKVGPLEITCPRQHCYCGTDIIIPKYKVE